MPLSQQQFRGRALPLLLWAAVGCTEANPRFAVRVFPADAGGTGGARGDGGGQGGVAADAGRVPEVAPELDLAEDDAGIAADQDGSLPDGTPDAAVEPPKDAAPVVDLTRPPEVAPEVAAPDPLLKDLVAHWTFEEGRGTVVVDAVGGNNGTFSSGGVTWKRNNFNGVRAKSLWSIELDGTNGYVTLALQSIPDIDADKSITFWMLTNENRAGQHNILSLTNVPAMQGIQVGLNVARLAAWQFNENSGFIETGVTSSWLHVAYTFDGREHSLYVNGQQRAVSAAPGQQQGRVTAARIGTWDPGMEMFRGTLDDMRIYKRALSSDEVRTLFENGD